MPEERREPVVGPQIVEVRSLYAGTGVVLLNPFGKYPADRRKEAVRWAACLAVVLFGHGLAAMLLFLNVSEASDFDAGAPVVMLDLPEIVAAPAIPPSDLAPGPPEIETEATPPEEKTKPPEPEAEVALPIPEPPKPKPPQEERTATAMPAVAVPLSLPAPPTAGAAVQTVPKDVIRWESELAAHIERFKRYPSEARARDKQGIAKVAFTIDRDGQVLTARIVQSSGSPSLDNETLAMLARAQPMPRPPTDIPTTQLSFVVPVRFNIK
jgi:protein TonB